MAEEGTISIEWSVELSRAEPQCHRYSAQGQSPLFPHIRSLINLKEDEQVQPAQDTVFFRESIFDRRLVPSFFD